MRPLRDLQHDFDEASMTSRERFLTAMQNRVPDRVPVTPDISNYIPCKRTGLPFWDIYFNGQVPLWRAYLDAADYYGIDAWNASCWGYGSLYVAPANVEHAYRTEYRADRDAMICHTTVHTPDGDLTGESLCFRADPPSPTQKLMKDLARDFARFKWLLQPPAALNMKMWEEARAECRKRGHAFGMGVCYPGFHNWHSSVQGGVETLTYAHADTPEILDEWCDLQVAADTRGLELILALRPDYVLFGGLASKYAIPALAKWSRMCRAAGVPTVLHSCGKSRILVDMLVEETRVGCINPLEIPPMGDVDLAELKRARGGQIALMGNLHTTEVMLRGTPALVRRKAIEAMRDAGPGGGFILSSGDQCPRDTPDANLFALVETAREFGVYEQATGRLPRLAGV
jgi:uroporphyrinogen decarboxylase